MVVAPVCAAKATATSPVRNEDGVHVVAEAEQPPTFETAPHAEAGQSIAKIRKSLFILVSLNRNQSWECKVYSPEVRITCQGISGATNLHNHHAARNAPSHLR